MKYQLPKELTMVMGKTIWQHILFTLFYFVLQPLDCVYLLMKHSYLVKQLNNE